MDQAIKSGIMGGMSVVDVRFIVECYNAGEPCLAVTPALADVGLAFCAAQCPVHLWVGCRYHKGAGTQVLSAAHMNCCGQPSSEWLEQTGLYG